MTTTLTPTQQRWARHRARRDAVGMRYPIAPLLAAIGVNPDSRSVVAEVATRLGMDRRWVRRVLHDGGLDRTDSADRWATKAGLNPEMVWPHWWDAEEDDDWYSDDPSLDELERAS